MISRRRAVLCTLPLLAALTGPGCIQSSALQCSNQTVQCGDTCVAIQTDVHNCGACAAACSGGNVCVAGACVCPTGQGICNGTCTSTATDPRNCGACGYQCGPDQACSQGVCQDCSGGGCVNTLVAACIDGAGGHLVRFQDSTAGLSLEAPVNPSVASFPDALGVLGTVLLYADHDSSTLLEVPLTQLGVAGPEQPTLVGSSTGQFAGTTQLLVENADAGTRLYATTSSVNAIRSFAGPPAIDAGTLLSGGSGALGLATTGGAAFAQGSFPDPFAKIGNDLFVPLNATGEVVRVDVSDPANAVVKETWSLQPLVDALPGGGKAADGGSFQPSPTGAIARNGMVYVAANVIRFHPYPDINPDYGPPLVARIDPSKTGGAALSAVKGFSGDAGTCQNVEFVASIPSGTASTAMLVSCAGARTYDASFNVQSVQNTQLALFNPADQQVASWVPSNGPSANPPSVGRAVPFNTSVYVADETSARLYVVDIGSSSLVERVGYVDGGTPAQLCPTYINDIAVVPVVP